MNDSLQELLAPHLSTTSGQHGSILSPSSASLTKYLARIGTLSLSSLTSTESQSLAQSSHSNDLSLQALASRSYKAVIASADNLSTLRESLPSLATAGSELQRAIPKLDEDAVKFSTTYSKANNENAILDRRKKVTLLSRNVDRLSDILELPILLSSAISSASAPTGSNSSSSSGANYSTALDLFAHVKRLQLLYPDSTIIKSVLSEAEEAMKDMTTSLISSLRSQNIRLAAAIRTIGWLRRVAPDLSTTGPSPSKPNLGTQTSTGATSDDSVFGSVFLTARLANLLNMLEALSPLRDLADQETERRVALARHISVHGGTPAAAATTTTTSGHQTERYLKRYIEIFREQSFTTVSMYRNIFPAEPGSVPSSTSAPSSLLLPLPSALASFPLHLVDILTETLKAYLPNVTDPTTRESLLTQVLYAAGSLGRLGADFSMMIALLDDDDDDDVDHNAEAGSRVNDEAENRDVSRKGAEVGMGQGATKFAEAVEAGIAQKGEDGTDEEEFVPEWVKVMKKHRIQAGRLEALAAGQEQLMTRRGSSDTVVK